MHLQTRTEYIRRIHHPSGPDVLHWMQSTLQEGAKRVADRSKIEHDFSFVGGSFFFEAPVDNRLHSNGLPHEPCGMRHQIPLLQFLTVRTRVIYCDTLVQSLVSASRLATLGPPAREITPESSTSGHSTVSAGFARPIRISAAVIVPNMSSVVNLYLAASRSNAQR
jgi:hypothetical protein